MDVKQKEAFRLLKSFKGSHYSFGIDCINQLGGIAVKHGKKVCVVALSIGKSWSKPLHDAVLQSLTEAGLDKAGGMIEGARPNAPMDDVYRIADAIAAQAPDVVVTVGGGSSIDATKAAVAYLTFKDKHPDLNDYFGVDSVTQMVDSYKRELTPVVAVQVASGSAAHLTRYSNITDFTAMQKLLIIDDAVVPPDALFDYRFTASQPAGLTMDGGLDGISHCLEVLMGISDDKYNKAKPVSLLGIDLIVNNLRKAVDDPGDLEAREAIGLGTDLGGYAIMIGGTNGAHLNSFSMTDILSHGRACALLNPYYVVFFAPAIEDRLRDAGKIYKEAGYLHENIDTLAGRDLGIAVAKGMTALSEDIGFPVTLNDVDGFTDEHISRCLEAAKNPKLASKLQNMPVRLSADLVDEYMQPVLLAAKTGDMTMIKNKICQSRNNKKLTMQERIYLDWQTGHHGKKGEKPVHFFPSTVPGAVQLDFAKANNYGDYWYAKNWQDYLWMEDSFWTYQASFAKPEMAENQKILFVSKGIDYQYEIMLNGELLHAYEGMFAPVELDLTGKLKAQNSLEVLIYPAPKSHAKARDRFQADQSCKPAVSYGWDWHPRLIPLGIWDETFLEIVPRHRIVDAEVSYILHDNMEEAAVDLLLETSFTGDGHAYRWKIIDANGHLVFEQKGKIENNQMNLKGNLEHIELWWPYNYGNQPLYMSIVELLKDDNVVDTREQTVGFRKVALVMNEGSWDEPVDFPKSRSNAPITMEINGKRIFTKGSNWVPPEIFPGMITRERYDSLLNMAIEANLDMLRVWGGGIVNKDSFYALCDEKGILVWQEFPLACNNYRGTEKYLDTLNKESEAIIERLRRHASVVIWCGGNELFNDWSGMTDQSLAIRLLNKLCYSLDKHTPFLPTAPVVGMGHGPYGFLDPVTKEELFVKMKNAHNTAYSECSSTGPASVGLLKRIIPAKELFPPKPGTAWEDHHGFAAWDAEPESHLLLSMLEKYFGPAQNLEELIDNGQFIQYIGMQCLFEEGRRQKPYCSMVLTWCYNEAWPCAAGGSAISWPQEPKPAYFAMQQSCRPVLASAQIEKLVWTEGEVFESDIWLLNDSFNVLEPCKIKVSIEGDERIDIMDWYCAGTPGNENLIGPRAKIVLPAWSCKRFTLKVSVAEHPEWNSEYVMLYKRKETAEEGKRGMNV